MTLIRNNPGSKQERRISAQSRLEKLIERYEMFFQTDARTLVVGTTEFMRQEIVTKARIAKNELKVLTERIAKGGRKSTKKTGVNTGRRM